LLRYAITTGHDLLAYDARDVERYASDAAAFDDMPLRIAVIDAGCCCAADDAAIQRALLPRCATLLILLCLLFASA